MSTKSKVVKMQPKNSKKVDAPEKESVGSEPVKEQQPPTLEELKATFAPGETIQVEAVGVIAILEKMDSLLEDELLTLFEMRQGLNNIQESTPVSYLTQEGVELTSLASFLYHTLVFAKEQKQKPDAGK